MMRVLIVAGEASGDAHAAKVASLLRQEGAQVSAVGGAALEAAGAELVGHIDELAVLGFVEVIGRLPRILQVKKRLEALLRESHFDLLLPVDYPGFNLRLARHAQRCGVPVLYYIGPQVWAWRQNRLRTLRQVAAHVALILPFEKPLYDRWNIPSTFVGHPLLDDPPPSPAEPDIDLGLFPGSRPQEVARHLPVLLESARRLRDERPGLRIVISRASTAPEDAMSAAMREHGFELSDLVAAPAGALMRRCRALLVASGTATLEAALSERPFAVLYRTGAVNWAVARRLVHLQHASLVNLVAGEAVVREYLQEAAQPDALAAEARRLLGDEPERRRQLDQVRRVRARLGTPGAAARVTRLALQVASRARGVHA